jgi:hypothetical protein
MMGCPRQNLWLLIRGRDRVVLGAAKMGIFSMTVRRFSVTAVRNQIMLQKIALYIRLHVPD